jgi:hypothetical protein
MTGPSTGSDEVGGLVMENFPDCVTVFVPGSGFLAGAVRGFVVQKFKLTRKEFEIYFSGSILS